MGFDGDLILLVDSRERTCNYFNTMLERLKENGVPYQIQDTEPVLQDEEAYEQDEFDAEYSASAKNEIETPTTQKLLVGDYVFVRAKDEKQKIVMVIERKEFGDYVGSLKDGRYDKQKFNMKLLNSPEYEFIIVGDPSRYPAQFSTGVATIAANKRGVRLYDSHEFIWYLIRTYQRLKEVGVCNYSFEFPKEEQMPTFEEFAASHLSKQSVNTPQRLLFSSICLIKGIGLIYAEAIAKEFTSVSDLCIKIQDAKTLKRLSTIKANGRKISKKALQNLQLFYKSEDSTVPSKEDQG